MQDITGINFHQIFFWIKDSNSFSVGGVRVRVRVRVVRVVHLELFAHERCGFESRQGLWHLSCEEAILKACVRLMVLLRYPSCPK